MSVKSLRYFTINESMYHLSNGELEKLIENAKTLLEKNREKKFISMIESIMKGWYSHPNRDWTAKYRSIGHDNENDYIEITWKYGVSSMRIQKNSIVMYANTTTDTTTDTTTGCTTYAKFLLTPDKKVVFTLTFEIINVNIYDHINETQNFRQPDLKSWLFSVCIIYSPLALQFDEIKNSYYKTLN